MTEEEIKAIETHTEIHAKAERRAIKITEILRKAVRELRENNRLKAQIGEMINEIDKTMILSNMREREIYDIQEIFRKYNFRRDSNDKWEFKE